MNNVQNRSIPAVRDANRGSNAETAQTITSLRDEVEACLDRLIPARSAQSGNLHDVMRYSLLNGGKRVRAILCILVCEAAGDRGRAFALHAGCAIEMVHAASLILDDLPCMDAAKLRRGRPTAHSAFGDASSILASIGLLNRAYEVIAEQSDTDERSRCAAIRALTKAVGTDGMITGQDLDLHRRETFSDVDRVEHLNWLKTGVLFCTSAEIGAIAAGLGDGPVDAVKRFATHVGLAFQTADDLIDQQSNVQSAGKDVRQDELKPTLVSLTGANGARRSCREHLDLARAALLEAGLNDNMLNDFIDFVFANHVST